MSKQRKWSIEPLEDRLVMDGAAPVYSFDGVGNNMAHIQWGSTNERLLRLAPPEYGNGVSSPAGANRPSARVISNTISSQDEDIISDRLMSAMVYAWGQFIDHDIGLTPTGTTESFPIAVPQGDPYFDPNNTGTQTIPLKRSIFDALTGTNNPREQINVLTTWLDASMVYGSDSITAAKLRTMSGGKMKTSPGNLLPINNATYFPTGTLTMANDAHRVPDNQLFAAGDTRANENIELTSLHTLFVREHNFWAEQFAAGIPNLTDEQIYQMARSRVIAEIQAITFNEWLPAVLGGNGVRPYQGYNPNVNPGLANEFSTAAFRFGHSLLGDDVEFLDNNGIPVRDDVSLADAFFNPTLVSESNIAPILKYLASDPSSELDTKVVDSVRNFLFGPPGSGGLDLASLNIQRGRDHGLADYNDIRQAYGLPRVQSFAGITRNVEVQAKLQQLYGNVNNIDLWVGALAEDHVPGASVGPTLKAVISNQFERIRDGDRLWYQRIFGGPVLNQIANTRLSDILKRNTGTTNLQQNVFYFKTGISGTAFIDNNRDGRLQRGEQPLANRPVQLIDTSDNSVVDTVMTNSRGEYQFGVADGVRTGRYRVRLAPPPGGTAQTPSSRTVAITRGDQFLNNVDIAIPPGPPGFAQLSNQGLIWGLKTPMPDPLPDVGSAAAANTNTAQRSDRSQRMQFQMQLQRVEATLENLEHGALAVRRKMASSRKNLLLRPSVTDAVMEVDFGGYVS